MEKISTRMQRSVVIIIIIIIKKGRQCKAEREWYNDDDNNNNILWQCPVALLNTVTQFTPATIHHYVQRSVWQELFQYRHHRTSNTHRAEPIENALMVNHIKSYTEINLQDPSFLPLSNALWLSETVYGTHTKVHHRYPDLSDKQTGWLEAHHCMGSINRPRRTDTRRSNTLDNTDVIEIGW